MSEKPKEKDTTQGAAASIELVLDSGSRIIIEPSGRVIIENLTADLLDVATALNPDDLSLQCRVALREDEADEGGEAP